MLTVNHLIILDTAQLHHMIGDILVVCWFLLSMEIILMILCMTAMMSEWLAWMDLLWVLSHDAVEMWDLVVWIMLVHSPAAVGME